VRVKPRIWELSHSVAPILLQRLASRPPTLVKDAEHVSGVEGETTDIDGKEESADKGIECPKRKGVRCGHGRVPASALKIGHKFRGTNSLCNFCMDWQK